ncbi:MAG: hypothetical protein QHC90_08065 [Shinella sp.]|jgi:hypothetical protein|nr:hypothetical protein [Shinella sp.]
MSDPDKDPALAPSADSSPRKERKLLAGKGLAWFIAGVAVAAFLIYLFIVFYGVTTGD